MTRKRFSADEVGQELSGHQASACFFSQNGVRIFVHVEVGIDRVSYLVEILSSSETKSFDTLGQALQYAEENQR